MVLKKLYQQISPLIFLCVFLYGWNAHAQGNPPSISNTGTETINYQEGAAPVVLSANLLIADNDSPNMLLATFTFGGTYASAQDTLIFAETANIKADFDETSGVLRLLSVPANQGVSLADMQTAMRSVQYSLTSDNPTNRTVAVNISVTDTQGNISNTASRSINTSAANDAPEISSNSTASTDGTNTDTRVFDEVEILDPDGSQIIKVEIEIAEGFNSPEDRLFIQGSDGGLKVDEQTAQRIVLSGAEDIRTYENVIRRFFYGHQPFFFRSPGTRKINLRVYDSNNTVSNTLSRFIIIQPTSGPLNNLPPNLLSFSVETNENTNYSFLASDFANRFNDPNGNSLSAIIIRSLPQSGKLFLGENEITNAFILAGTQISPDQIPNLSYRPAAGFNGTDSFTWNARDQDSFAANDAKVSVQVLPVNQAPVLNVPANADVEEDTATPIQGISLSDPNRDELRVTVSVNSGLLFLAPKAIEGGFVDFLSGTGNGQKVIIFSGPANLAAFALSGLNYQPNDGFTGQDQLSVEVDDNQGGVASGSTTLNVLLINDAPVLANIETTPASFTENGNAISVTATLTITDEENDQISSATVAITQGFATGQDVLAFTGQNPNVTASYDNASGILTLTGNANIDAYRDILRSIAYSNSSEKPTEGDRVISFAVTDNGNPKASSTAISRTIRVVPVNDAPVLANLESAPISYDILDKNPVAITNALTVTDVDNENLTRAVIAFEEGYINGEDVLSFTAKIGNIVGNWNANQGILTLSVGGTKEQYQQAIRSITYQNTGENDGGDETKLISITVSDGNANSNQLTRPIIIITNDPPVISSFSKTINEDEVLAFAIEDFTYEDPDNGPSEGLQSIAITTLPANGILIVAEDTITAADLENSPSGFGISAEQISTLKYVPNPNFSGADSFGWNAFDGAEYAIEAVQVNITITAQPDAPLPSDFPVETPEDQAYAFTAEQFANAAPDPDGGDLAGIIIRTVPQNGILRRNNITLPANSALSLAELNNLQYIPNQNYSGEDTFSWAASDGTLVSQQAAQVLINVVPVNDPPIINSFTKAISEEESNFAFAASDFTENYVDIENTPLNFIQITSLPGKGSLLLNGSPIEAGVQINAENIANLQYQAVADQTAGIVSFGWNASDGANLATTAAKVTVIIGTGVTDFAVNTNEDTEYAFSRSQFANNYGNPKGALQSIRIEALPINGTLLLNDESVNVDQEISGEVINQLTYLPAENYFGEDSLVWNANGGDGFAPAPAQVFISVASVNDPPVVQPIASFTLLAGQSSGAVSVVISDQETAAEELSLSVMSGNESIIPTAQINLGGSGANRTLTLSALPDTQEEVVITLLASDGETQSQQSFTVSVVPYLISFDVESTLDACIDNEETLEVNIEGGEAPYTFNADCDQENCQLEFSNGSILLNPSVSTTYYLSLTDANGVISNVDTLVVTVNDCTNIDLEIPTAFTPDGDQVNDVWEIENIQFATNVNVQVYDRYGAEVFSSEGYPQAWDGTYENAMLPVGTYYYVIHADGGLQSYKGSVTLLR